MADAHSPLIEAYRGVLPQIGSDVYIHRTATVIGDVALGDDVSVWPGVVIRGDINHIHIGAGSNIQDLSVLHVNHKSPEDPAGSALIIGSNVTVGHSVILHGCTIEDECLIGMGSIVMDKVLVQKRVLLAAGSLVPQGMVLESGYLYMGRPAKKIRPLTSAEVDGLMYSAQHYIEVKNHYLAG
jgi:carbonic anhydrase/acetyltransferase-like protein (isoleucine patch superfamily)